MISPRAPAIYLPDVRRYFIVEGHVRDGPAPEEGPCHARGGRTWRYVDLARHLDRRRRGERVVCRRCTEQVTGVRAAIFHPADNFVVALR